MKKGIPKMGMNSKCFKNRLNKERQLWKCNQTMWRGNGQKRMILTRSVYTEFSQPQLATLDDENTIFSLVQRGHL